MRQYYAVLTVIQEMIETAREHATRLVTLDFQS